MQTALNGLFASIAIIFAGCFLMQLAANISLLINRRQYKRRTIEALLDVIHQQEKSFYSRAEGLVRVGEAEALWNEVNDLVVPAKNLSPDAPFDILEPTISGLFKAAYRAKALIDSLDRARLAA
ncbi:MAG: hypothetical protein AB7W16_06375 [Candidatus Obscuribacterales bacterium]